MDVSSWLRDLGLANYAPAFRANHIDAEVLPQLTAEDLIALGITSIGHRRKLLDAIAALDQRRAPAAAEPRAATVRPLEAERRQLTVLFCDLVGSTELAARLDPEDLREVMQAYQAACAGVIARFEGHVARFLGDGVLAYFGWPKAHEDDAERAVRAGLATVEEIGRLSVGTEARLAARIGIATGQVVVGDLTSQDAPDKDSVIGDTPNLAARLQTLAEPGTIIIGRRTWRLVDGLFDLEDLGAHNLKGFAEPVHAWRVLGPSQAEGRFEARQAAGLTQLVGREQEIALLLDLWQQAKDGEGQVVLLSGEPGIGKSRIILALRERLGDEPYTPLSHFCSPFHQTSALYPVIGLLERAADFTRDDSPKQKLDKLETLLCQATEDLAAAAPVIAALLSIPAGDRYPDLTLSPQQHKEKALRALVGHFVGLAAKQPMLALYEDVHWSDPTTLELLQLLIERVQRLPVLMIVTFRPDFQPPWRGPAEITSLKLNRLSRKRGAAMVAELAGGKALPAEVLEQIVAKTDGVPLFVEELTKAVLESGLLREESGCYALAGPLPPLAIPTTLQDSLLARLDRLAPVKEVAQIGAAIGREFSYELLAAVAPLGDNGLQDALSRLTEAELVFRRGTPPDATYSFKHALVRDAAYQSLLRSKRQQLQTRIAQILEERFPTIVETQPQLLAQHCTEAGLIEKAVDYWQRAGERAGARSAMAEAVAQLSKGLEVLQSLPDGPERTRRELGLQAALGGALIAARSYAAPETGRAFARARELCRQVGDTPQLFPVLFGLYVHHLVRAEPAAAREVAGEMLHLAERNEDTAAQVVAHRAVGSASDDLGDLVAARAHLEQALGLYDPVVHRSLAFVYAQDPRVAGLCWLSRLLFVLGYPEQALRRVGDARLEAREVAHPHTVAHALSFGCNLCQFLQDRRGVREQANALITLCTTHDFPFWLALGTIYQGWALADGGQAAEGIAQMQEGLAAYWATGGEHRSSYLLALLAEAHGTAAEITEALNLLAEALDRVERSGERWYEAELHRRRGELLLALSEPDHSEAEACLHRAIEVAREQSAKMWELRAAASLARLWVAQGERAKARDLLAPVYGWFTEGFDTADLKDAKGLLDELS